MSHNKTLLAVLAVATSIIVGIELASAQAPAPAPVPAPGEVSGPPQVDARLKAALDRKNIIYSIDDYNSFVIKWDNQNTGRSQRSIVLSRVDGDAGGKLKVREIISLAFVTDGQLDPQLMETLLRQNMGTQFGGWAVNSNNDGQTCLWYVAEVDANASIDAIIVASQFVGNMADAKENELRGGVDEF